MLGRALPFICRGRATEAKNRFCFMIRAPSGLENGPMFVTSILALAIRFELRPRTEAELVVRRKQGE